MSLLVEQRPLEFRGCKNPAWSLGKPLDKILAEDWLKRIQPYVQAGQVEWITLPQIYDAYIQWEQSQQSWNVTLRLEYEIVER